MAEGSAPRKKGPKRIIVRGASRDQAVAYVSSKLRGLQVTDKGSELYVQQDALRAAKFHIRVDQNQVTFDRAPALTSFQAGLVGILIAVGLTAFFLYAAELIDVIVLFVLCGGVEAVGLLALFLIVPGLLFGSGLAYALAGAAGGAGQQQQQQVVIVLPRTPGEATGRSAPAKRTPPGRGASGARAGTRRSR